MRCDGNSGVENIKPHSIRLFLEVFNLKVDGLLWVGISRSLLSKIEFIEWPVWRMLQNTSSKKIEIANFLVTVPNRTRQSNCSINY